jgi:hypothetical protein
LTSASLPAVDQTIIDGSTTAVSGNAVFDGLAGKANLNGGNGFTGSQWFSDFTRHAKQISLGTNSLSHGSLYSPVALGNINGHFAFASDTKPPVVISTELLTNLSLVKLIVPNNSGTIALLSDIPSPTEVDQTIVDGSTNAVSGNAVFDALATKAPISSVHNPVTIGTANGLSLSTQQLSLGLASSGVTGALSGTDWNTFNNKADLVGNKVPAAQLPLKVVSLTTPTGVPSDGDEWILYTL